MDRRSFAVCRGVGERGRWLENYGQGTERADCFEVHGGLTFAGAFDEAAPEGHGICQIPEAGRPVDVAARAGYPD